MVQVEPHLTQFLRQPARLQGSHPVFAGDRSPELQGGGNNSMEGRFDTGYRGGGGVVQDGGM